MAAIEHVQKQDDRSDLDARQRGSVKVISLMAHAAREPIAKPTTTPPSASSSASNRKSPISWAWEPPRAFMRAEVAAAFEDRSRERGEN